MEPKEYQLKTLSRLADYLAALDVAQAQKAQVDALNLGISYDVPAEAWKQGGGKQSYQSRRNGIGEDIPTICFKIPTGGGKTFLATLAVEQIQLTYRKQQAGLILWIVPTTAIYRQTLTALRTREHPYRQALDRASGGKTLVLEKTDIFTPQQITEYLVIMLLMLPSANRQDKETLKLFQDSTGFAAFFPDEADGPGQAALLQRVPNLDQYSPTTGWGAVALKTSLGNTLRLLRPLVVLDEGHKAYSEGAQATLRGFNPCFVLELSATPGRASNVLVAISGQELLREEMIKLDLNIINKADSDWHTTLLAAVRQIQVLDERAREYESNSGRYIRPICLVQVERTGKDQEGNRFIHANDVRNHLIKQCGISPTQIAIKSSENDGLENIDLLSPDCPIQYIITKQALQEGWDCAFAYVLVVLTNPSSQISITQLVGRILRQPNAKKTGIKDLDESYVFCFRRKARDLLAAIQRGFDEEGLGDIARHTREVETAAGDLVDVGYRPEFRKFEGKIYMPRFVIQEAAGYRNVSYEMDILRRIDWSQVDLSDLDKVTLGALGSNTDQWARVGYHETAPNLVDVKTSRSSEVLVGEIDKVFMTQQITDIVPNPWVAYNIVSQTVAHFLQRYDQQRVATDMVLIIDELKKLLMSQRDAMAEHIFRTLLAQQEMCFFLQAITDYALPTTIRVPSNSRKLTRDNNDLVQRNLFEYVPEEEFNETERAVAVYLDEQAELLFWYRNMVGPQYYSIQGWQRLRIYPDFITTRKDPTDATDYHTICVLETKGLHLKGNADTTYKQNIFALCNELGRATDWDTICAEFGQKQIHFQVVYEDEWQVQINQLFT
jgi:type III restriction enzyme